MGGQPKPGDEDYLKFDQCWLIVKLKDIKDMENPPINYKDLLEQFDDYEHEVVKTQPGITKCTCHKSNKHAKDCRIHPHHMLILKDLSGSEMGVPSLCLEPTLFDEEKFNEKIKPIPKVNEIEEKVDPIEKEEILETNPETNPAQTKEIREFSVVYFDGTNLPLVCKPSDFLSDSFVLDEKTGSWLFENFEGSLGQVTFLGPARKNGFIIVIEAGNEQVKEMVKALLLCLRPYFRQEFREELIKNLPE